MKNIHNYLFLYQSEYSGTSISIYDSKWTRKPLPGSFWISSVMNWFQVHGWVTIYTPWQRPDISIFVRWSSSYFIHPPRRPSSLWSIATKPDVIYLIESIVGPRRPFSTTSSWCPMYVVKNNFKNSKSSFNYYSNYENSYKVLILLELWLLWSVFHFLKYSTKS